MGKHSVCCSTASCDWVHATFLNGFFITLLYWRRLLFHKAFAFAESLPDFGPNSVVLHWVRFLHNLRHQLSLRDCRTWNTSHAELGCERLLKCGARLSVSGSLRTAIAPPSTARSSS